MGYGELIDLSRRTASYKALCNKAFNITKKPKYDEYPRRMASFFIYFLIKNLLVLILQVVLIKVKLCQTNS